MTNQKEIFGQNLLPLDEIAETVFGITPRIAQRKAATNTLPIPAFRISGTRKGPLYVLREDLEKWLKERTDRARDQHRKMQAV